MQSLVDSGRRCHSFYELRQIMFGVGVNRENTWKQVHKHFIQDSEFNKKQVLQLYKESPEEDKFNSKKEENLS